MNIIHDNPMETSHCCPIRPIRLSFRGSAFLGEAIWSQDGSCISTEKGLVGEKWDKNITNDKNGDRNRSVMFFNIVISFYMFC